MKRIFLLFTALLWISYSTSQNINNLEYNWDEKPDLATLSSGQDTMPSVVLFFGHRLGIDYTDKERKNLSVIKVTHKLVKINSSSEIEKYNKVYIGVNDGEVLEKVSARSISKDGKITVVDQAQVKEVKDDHDKNSRIIAIEGAEEGGYIEFFYILRKQISLYGNLFFQFEAPLRDAEFVLSAPDNLIYEQKWYNVKAAVTDTVIEGYRILTSRLKDVPGRTSEDFSPTHGAKARVEYKLATNTANMKGRLYTWNDAAQTFYEIYRIHSKDEMKAAKGLLKKIELSGKKNEKDLFAIDHYFKSNFFIDPNLPTEDIASIIKKKYCSGWGALRTYCALLNESGFRYELVLTTDRDNYSFDPEFDSWNFLVDGMIYFPDFDKFLVPGESSVRYGLVPFGYTANKGLFIKKVEFGGTESGLGEIREIPAEPAESTFDEMMVKIRFNTGADMNTFEVTRKLGGYNVSGFFYFLPLMKDEDKDNLLKSFVEYMVQDAKYTSKEIKNKNFGIPIQDTAFVVQAVFESNALIDAAGEKILFKIGEVIGEQMEMYKDDKRVTPIENHFNRVYHRKIYFTVPENYVLKNPEVLNFNVICGTPSDSPYGFISSYKIDGNTYEITIDEYYKQIFYPLSKYEEYRKVINAAADFNKVQLILEKK